MSKITILKDVNKIEVNDFNTIKIAVKSFSFEKVGYKIRRKPQKNIIMIRGWLKDDSYKESINSTWGPIMDPSGGLVGTLNTLLSVTGMGSLKTKAMYTQIWKDTKPLDFSFNIYFHAHKNAYNDVVRPVRELQKLVLPREKTNSGEDSATKELWKLKKGASREDIEIHKEATAIYKAVKSEFWNKFLLPPSTAGINLKNLTTKGEGYIGVHYIQVGKFIRLKDIVLQNVDVDWGIGDSDADGYPLTALVTIKCMSRTIWTNETIDGLLVKGDISKQINSRTDMKGEPEILNVAEIGSTAVDLIKKKLGFNKEK